jgi:CubicO group peptidase (beta-lactamase class C family)
MMILLKNSICALALLTIVCGCNTGSTAEAQPSDDSLDYYPPTPASLSKEEFRHYLKILPAFFDSTLLDKNFNGGIIIAKAGAILYEKYVGMIDIRKKDSLTDSTSIHIASTSKTFTAVALLRLVQEGKLSLNDSLTKFFPGLPYPGITVQMLLNHRSGLPNYVNFADRSKNWNKKQYLTNEDMLNMLYTEKPAKSFPPGKHFSYSNTNFVLAAMIIEKVTGRKFPEYMQSKFFGPLQMNHTYIFTPADSARSTPSFNYNGNWWQNDFLEYTYGDKNVYTTPRDLLKWDQALYTDQVLGKALLDSAFTPYSNEKPSIHNYGLGFRLLMMPNGKKVVYHFGRWHGFNAAFSRLIDEKVTIIILGNKFTRNIYNTAMHSYDLFGPYNQRQPQEDDDSPESVTEKKEPAKSKASSKKRR